MLKFIRNENGYWEAKVEVKEDINLKVVIEGPCLAVLYLDGEECSFTTTPENIIGKPSKIQDLILEFFIGSTMNENEIREKTKIVFEQ
jgi:hypothetical protein